MTNDTEDPSQQVFAENASSQANSSQANSSQANSSQANSSQANPSQANPSQANPFQANYYERLGVRPNASVQEIRRAYRDLSKLYHPDTTELESAIAIPKFQALNEAYATLSSPEKRLAYDYKSGFSRMSVMQSFLERDRVVASANASARSEKFSTNAYIDPTDRPLSAGEFFALFILGITFIACLLLVLTLSLTKSDTISPKFTFTDPTVTNLTVTDRTAIDRTAIDRTAVDPTAADITANQPDASSLPVRNPADLSPFTPELPQASWLMPKSRSAPAIPAE